MSIIQLTRRSVLLAIAECEALGREQFLERGGYSAAREYFLIHNGRAYDSKAIAGAAHQIHTGEKVYASDFRGGVQITDQLRSLGFTVSGSTDWTWDELLLACDLLASGGWAAIPRNSPEIFELSDLLRAQNPVLATSPSFRNINSVNRKLEDLRSAHPSYVGKQTKGGQRTAQMTLAFVEKYESMHRAATALRSLERFVEEEDEDFPAEDSATSDEVAQVTEGRVIERIVTRRERNSALRKAKVDKFRRRHGRLYCELCKFDFARAYGPHGDGYIEVHHRVPLHASGEVASTADDLILLCANCHRMIHYRSPWKTPDELGRLMGIDLG